MNKYEATYCDQKATILAEDDYKAKQAALQLFRPKTHRASAISVQLKLSGYGLAVEKLAA